MHSVAEREILWNLGPERFFVYPLLFLAMAYTLKGFWDHARLWLIGKGPIPTDNLAARANTVLQYALGHRRIAFGYREAYAGLMHTSIFVGFMTLVLVTTIIAIEDWLWIMFQFSFLRGPIYLGYSLIGDLGGLLLLFGVGLAFYRRYVQHSDRVSRPSPTDDDGRALAVLAFLAVNGFVIEGIRILMTELADHRAWAMWSPVGMAFASFFGLFGLGDDALSVLHRISWTTHLITVALFIAMIPNTKFAHIVLSSASMFFRDPVRNTQAKGALVPIENIEQQMEEGVLGVTKLTEFRFDQLVQFDGCTNCGRCQDNCPAYLSGKPLSPRKLIQDLRRNLLDVGPIVADGGEIPEEKKLIGVTIQEDTLWSCVTCRACMENCPVLIEHIPAIVDMRRSIVMMGEGEMPETAQAALVNMERRGHPWRGSQHVRGDWMEKAGDVQEFTDGNEIEYLFWVGCTGALEDRAQKVTLATIQVLQAAGVNFGVLGPEETCTGDPARRMGNEYLFQTMAQMTIEILQSRNTKKIITNCPHCFNTFKNEYPQMGGHFEVVHHTQIINEIMKSGKLRMRYSVESGDDSGEQRPVITYHDSCYLGRHNGEFEAPRDIVAALPGVESVVEMERNREKSFCCGAGGGHMWMDMRLGERINKMRSEQANNTGANIVATACPFCAIMFEDGIKQIDRVEQLKVRDIAELVAETLEVPESANVTGAKA